MRRLKTKPPAVRSLTTRLMVVIGGLAAGGALLTLAVAGVLSVRAVDEEARHTAMGGASEVAAACVETLAAAVQVSEELGTNASMAVRLGHATRERYLTRSRGILEREPNLSGVWLIAEPDGFDGPDARHRGEFGSSADGEFYPYWYRRPDGTIVQDTTGARKDVAADRAQDFYRLPATRDRATIVAPFGYRLNEGRGPTRSMFSVAVPVKVGVDLIGVAGVDLFLDHLSALLGERIEGEPLEFAVIGEGGAIVASSRPEWRGRRAEAVGLPAVEAPAGGALAAVSVADWAGDPASIAAKRVALRDEDQSWTVLVAHPRAAAYAEIAKVITVIMLLATLLVMGSVMLAYWLGRSLAQPVADKAGAMRRMADGDLEVPAPSTAAASELQDMALALEQFRRSARQALEAEAGRKAAEAIAREKSALLHVLSHEVRTPLNGILGMAQALAREPMPERQREAVQVILGAGYTLGGLLDGALEQSRIQSGEVALTAVRFAPADTVRQAGMAVRRQCRAKGLRLSVNTRPLGAQVVVGDEPHFRQILDILLSNALRFTDAGQISVDARMEARGPDRLITVEVRDTGIGISEEAKDRLFTAFGMADASSTRTHGGAGLGLALCRDLVELMGGQVQVESRSGAGSTFRVLLPMKAAEAAAAPAPPPGPLGAATKAMRILVAEDNRTNRQVVAALLSPLEAEIAFAEDGAAAVDMFVRSKFDLVLMDLRMPVMDGWEATRRIREAETAAGTPPTPVIAVTANTSPADLQRCRESGVDAVVAKPIRLAELFETMAAVLGAAAAGKAEVQLSPQ
ncbi:MAG: ATP-binding protein [Phenylobacterium sp.]|jgi:signal transduction histidine kinase|uniref:ATP-binding protein n=1 Tax=Phenylobacterium sp. TaxID=1871053 RepID=UPI002A358558|nr:ATP-binding protein [Phenylobacterium sp.]MDX9998519.1 ATP-binding protein [Phenylobacterium sp.]